MGKPSRLTLTRNRVSGSTYPAVVTYVREDMWAAQIHKGAGVHWSIHFDPSQWPVEGEEPAIGQVVTVVYRASGSGALWAVVGLSDPTDRPQGPSSCIACGDPTTECTCRDTCEPCKGDGGWYLDEGGYDYHTARRGPHALEWEACEKCSGEGEVLRYPRDRA